MKRVLSVVLALTLVLALAGSASAAPAEDEDPLTAIWPSEIYEQAKEVNPSKKTVDILLVVDMQKDFVDGALGTAEAEAIVPNVVAKIEEYKKEGKNLPVVHCVRYTEGWLFDRAVSEALAGYENLVVVEKPTFGSSDLVAIMGEYVATYGEPYVNLEIIGLCTDICVVSNALVQKAFYPEMPISLDASCCAAVTPATHEAALDTMTMCQINITNRAEPES